MKNISIQTTQIEQVRTASDLSPQLGSALNAARRGWLVIPVHGRLESGGCTCGNPACNSTAKHPLTAHGLLDGTSDIAAIQQWWNRSPDANVGFVTTGGFPFGFDNTRQDVDMVTARINYRWGGPVVAKY